jgi:hypothetical protein
MPQFKYMTGEEIQKGDRILFHRAPGQIEFIAIVGGDPDLDWYVQEYGGGVMVRDTVAGLTFIPADQLDEAEDLEFVSRAD